MSSSDLRSPVLVGRASERPGHATVYSTQGAQEGFIYVYGMPGEFTHLNMTTTRSGAHKNAYSASMQCFVFLTLSLYDLWCGNDAESRDWDPGGG